MSAHLMGLWNQTIWTLVLTFPLDYVLLVAVIESFWVSVSSSAEMTLIPSTSRTSVRNKWHTTCYVLEQCAFCLKDTMKKNSVMLSRFSHIEAVLGNEPGQEHKHVSQIVLPLLFLKPLFKNHCMAHCFSREKHFQISRIWRIKLVPCFLWNLKAQLMNFFSESSSRAWGKWWNRNRMISGTHPKTNERNALSQEIGTF